MTNYKKGLTAVPFYAAMTKDSKYTANKELLIIPGASHTDLYDGGENNVIPLDKIADFYTANLL